jgi:hypothetical protein
VTAVLRASAFRLSVAFKTGPMDTPKVAVPRNMVAVGNSKVLGTIAHSAISQGFGPGFVPPVWRVRDGRTNTYVLWDNFYGDMLAVIGLHRGSVNDVPPERPIGSSLSAESYELWVDATNQFQTEGTLPSTSCSPRLTCSSASRSTSTSSGTCGSRCRAPTTARPMPS